MIDLVIAPVVLPLLTAAILLGLGTMPRVRSLVSGGSAALQLVVAGLLLLWTAGGEVLAVALGGWGADLGIVWAVDILAALMLVLTAIVSVTTLLYAKGSLRPEEARYHDVLHHFLVAGVAAAFVTADLFNLFVAFEVMLVASFALIAIGGDLRRAFPYVLVNLVASALFLGGVGAVYGAAGTVNLAGLAERHAAGAVAPSFYVAMSLVMLVFAVKAALVPVFAWLPDAYPAAPLPVSAMFAGLLTKVGIYALYRVVTLLSGVEVGPIQTVLLPVAAATMLVGVVGALGRSDIRGILSFHVVSQVGYMAFGLAIYTPLAVAAGIFYIVHHILVKTALFFAGGLAEVVGDTGELGNARGLARTHPVLAVAFFLPALALVGVPPLSGFWGKLLLLVAGFGADAPIATGIAVLVSFLTLASMLKIWVGVFWGPVEGQVAPERGHDAGMLGAASVLVVGSVLVGLGAPAVLTLSERAADQLLAVDPYVEAVLAAGDR